MTLPDVKTIYEVVGTTWPCVRAETVGPWTIRFGASSGSRTSAATAHHSVTANDLPQAEAAMRELGQTPLFMIRAGDDVLDQVLDDAGYTIKDPVAVFAAPTASIATTRPPPVTSFTVWPPLAVQEEIWADGGIGPARLDVMRRAPHPKTTLLGRIDDRPAGTVYVGSANGCAMIHALEVASAHRRKGLARYLTQAAAFWALDQGLQHITLLATQANTAANTLYTSLGLSVVGQYHYRKHPTG